MKINLKEKNVELLFFLASLFSLIALATICFFLFKNGLPIFKEIGFKDFVLGTKWSPTDQPSYFGILPMILGSIYTTLGALILGAPLGIIVAIYLVYYCGKKEYKILKPLINLMAGVPSIVYGFFGMVVLLPVIRGFLNSKGPSILAASTLLAIMILPTIINLVESSLRAISKEYFQASLALGASKERSILKVVIPANVRGIFSALILGLGRAIGETMAVVMVAGNQERMPKGILKGVRTLTTNIVIEMSYASGLHRQALIGTALVLFSFILIINFSFFLGRRKHNG